MLYLSMGSTVIARGWVRCLTRVTSFFPFRSIFLIFPFSLLVQNMLFQIQSTARPEICLSEKSFWNRKMFNEHAVNPVRDHIIKSITLEKVPCFEKHFKICLINHLSLCVSHGCFVNDSSLFVGPVNCVVSEMKVEEDRSSHTSHKPPLVLPIKAHPMNGFTVAKYKKGLCGCVEK